MVYENKGLRANYPSVLCLSCRFGGVYLQEKVDQLTADLKLFNELKQSVEESSLKRDLQRNIQVCHRWISLRLRINRNISSLLAPCVNIGTLFICISR